MDVGDPVACGDERVVGGVDRRVAGRIVAWIRRPPERPPQPALVVVAGLDADRRRVQADEQQPVAERRQVGQRLDGAATDLDRRHVAAGPGRSISIGVPVVGGWPFIEDKGRAGEVARPTARPVSR